MDLGATLCLARSPQCLICPVRADCRASNAGRPEAYPLKSRKLKKDQFIPEASFVPSGVGEIAKLQYREGYVYLRP